MNGEPRQITPDRVSQLKVTKPTKYSPQGKSFFMVTEITTNGQIGWYCDKVNLYNNFRPGVQVMCITQTTEDKKGGYFHKIVDIVKDGMGGGMEEEPTPDEFLSLRRQNKPVIEVPVPNYNLAAQPIGPVQFNGNKYVPVPEGRMSDAERADGQSWGNAKTGASMIIAAAIQSGQIKLEDAWPTWCLWQERIHNHEQPKHEPSN